MSFHYNQVIKPSIAYKVETYTTLKYSFSIKKLLLLQDIQNNSRKTLSAEVKPRADFKLEKKFLKLNIITTNSKYTLKKMMRATGRGRGTGGRGSNTRKNLITAYAKNNQ